MPRASFEALQNCTYASAGALPDYYRLADSLSSLCSATAGALNVKTRDPTENADTDRWGADTLGMHNKAFFVRKNCGIVMYCTRLQIADVWEKRTKCNQSARQRSISFEVI